MKINFLKSPLYAALAAIMACGMTACSSDSNDGDNAATNAQEEAYKAIAEQYLANTVVVTYNNLATETTNLVAALQTLKADKTDANVASVCTTFLEARAWWEKSEAFLYGAASDYGIDPHIDSWPLSLSDLNNALNSGNFANMQGEDADVWAGENLGQSVLGFHGIEYIIFEDGSPKAASKITDDELVYSIAVAGDLRNKTYQLEAAWAGIDNVAASRQTKLEDLELPVTVSSSTFSYSENMLNAGQAGSTYRSWVGAMQAIVDGCKTIADEVGTSKIGKPHSGEDVSYIESPYSHNSITDFYDNIISIQNSYMGGIEGKRDETKSLHAYIKSVNEALDTKTVNAINNALAKIKAMKAPFVNNISDASAGDAIDACTALDDVLSEVKTQLAK